MTMVTRTGRTPPPKTHDHDNAPHGPEPHHPGSRLRDHPHNLKPNMHFLAVGLVAFLFRPPAGAIKLDTSSLPALPGGKEPLALHGLEQDAAGVGGRLWECAPALCRWQLSIAEQLRGTSVLELGSGTGACGIYAAALGAARVTLTDKESPFILMELLISNAARNRQLLGEAIVEVQPLKWGEESDGQQGMRVVARLHPAFGQVNRQHPVLDHYDWVIASDVTYDDDGHAPLCRTLRDLLANSNATHAPPRIVLCEEHGAPEPIDAPAGGAPQFADESIEAFARVAAGFGLGVRPFAASGEAGGEAAAAAPSALGAAVWPRAWPLAAFSNADGSNAQVCSLSSSWRLLLAAASCFWLLLPFWLSAASDCFRTRRCSLRSSWMVRVNRRVRRRRRWSRRALRGQRRAHGRRA